MSGLFFCAPLRVKRAFAQIGKTVSRLFTNQNARLDALLASLRACPGDINLDGVVNELDIHQWEMFAALAPYSSWVDINQDGFTDPGDLHLILQNFGPSPK